MAILPYNHLILYIMKKVIPSKGGKIKTSHCSSKIGRMTKKIDEFSQLLKSIQKCGNTLYLLFKSLFKVIPVISKIYSFLKTVFDILSAL
ncbi:hypothetical protein HMPREF2533_02100 [Bacteroides fragilis]|jgi:hypothetical protein|nr:hypothetical protein HMPREF2530_02100 [Bacteroides fragilis]KXU46297.1 hypothetical protein HMPREF2533_02100 [Bacteroides fragilis]